MKYGIIETKSRLIPGDERSRTNPGHGYPEHTESYISFTEFDSQDAVKTWIRNRKDGKYRLIEFQDLEVETKLQVDFKRPGVTRV